MSVDDFSPKKVLLPEAMDKVAAIVSRALDDGASVDTVEDMPDQLVVKFTIAKIPVILYLRYVGTGDCGYDFTSVFLGESQDLFSTSHLKKFCEFGLSFEAGRFTLLVSRLRGLLPMLSPAHMALEYSSQPANKTSVASHKPKEQDSLDRSSDREGFVSSPPAARSSSRSPTRMSVAYVLLGLSSGVLAGAAYFHRRDSFPALATTRELAQSSIPVHHHGATRFPDQSLHVHDRVTPENTCFSITTTVQASDHGLRTTLLRLESQHRQFFVEQGVTPDTLIAASIRSRHLAQNTAKQPSDPNHTIGIARSYHFGRVIPGDQVILQSCSIPGPTLTMVYRGGDFTLYRAAIN